MSGASTVPTVASDGRSLINVSVFDTRAPLVQFLPQRRQLAPDNIFNSLPGKKFHRGSEAQLPVELLGSDSDSGELDLDLNSEEVCFRRASVEGNLLNSSNLSRPAKSSSISLAIISHLAKYGMKGMIQR